MITETCVEVPRDKRTIFIENSGRRIGSASIVYARGNGGKEEWREAYALQAEKAVSA